jgi:hypothetical protein
MEEHEFCNFYVPKEEKCVEGFHKLWADPKIIFLSNLFLKFYILICIVFILCFLYHSL